MPWVIGIFAVFIFGTGGYAVDSAGKAVNNIGSGVLKIGAVVGVLYLMRKKLKWL